MALASRSSRRGGGRRWVIVGLVLTILVLLIDVSISSRSQAPVRQLSAQEWVGRVLPVIEKSNVGAREMQTLRTDSATLSAASLNNELTTLVDGARSAYSSYARLRPPSLVTAPAGLLETCLLERSQAVTAFAKTIRAHLAAPASTSSAPAARQLNKDIQRFEIADEAYHLFSGSLPKSAGGKVPPSRWVTDTSPYTPTSLGVWLQGLRSRISMVATHQVSVVALTTSPAPLGTSGTIETLTPSSTLYVTVVVGNVGNRTESNLQVKATVSSSSGTPADSDIISTLQSGSDTTIDLGPLGPRIGVDVTLTVTVAAPVGSPLQPVTSSIVFRMPSPTSTSTTVPGTTTPTT